MILKGSLEAAKFGLTVGAVRPTVLTLHGVGICDEVVAEFGARVNAKSVKAEGRGIVILRRNSQEVKVCLAGVALKRVVCLKTTGKAIM